MNYISTMKSKLTVALLLVGALGIAVIFSACGDAFLDTPPQGSLSQSTLASSVDGVETSLISAYKSLQGWTGNWGNETWGTAPTNWVFNTGSDDAHKGSEPGDLDAILQLELYQWVASLPSLSAKWKAVYEGIARSNATIKLAQGLTDVTEDERNRLIGEATFLRAHFHFDAYKIWKNIPYYYETDTDFRKPNDQDVLPLVIADLETAISLLPNDRSQVGRADKTVAQAYLGRVLLFAGDAQGAKTQLSAVVNSGKYALADCFYDNFSVAGNNNSESVFGIQASVNDGDGEGFNSNFADRLTFPHGSSPWGCCGFNQPTQNLANAYKVDANGLPFDDFNDSDIAVGDDTPVDPRIDWTIGRTDVPYLDWGPHQDAWIRGQGYVTFYSPKKNVHASGDAILSGSWSGAQLSALNYELIRYADVLLMLAEAEALTGGLSAATDLVNQIRTRAGNCAQQPDGEGIAGPADNPGITWANYQIGTYPTFGSQDEAMKAIKMERRLELAFEGHRLFDLQRWGDFKQVLNDFIAVERTKVDVLNQAETVTDKHIAFPLPTIEVELANGNLQQNEGY